MEYFCITLFWLIHSSTFFTLRQFIYILIGWQQTWFISYSCRFTFVIAFLLLLTGAALNDQHGEEGMYFGNYYCYVVKPGVFAGGAVLSLASVTLGILYYLTLQSAKNNNTNLWGSSSVPHQGGIAMGQPQFPQQSTQEPVFVHEDTYMRRQFTWLVIALWIEELHRISILLVTPVTDVLPWMATFAIPGKIILPFSFLFLVK